MHATTGIYFLYTPLCPLPWRLSVCLLNHHRGGGVVWCGVTRGGGCRSSSKVRSFCVIHWDLCSPLILHQRNIRPNESHWKPYAEKWCTPLPPPPAYTFFIHYDALLVLDDATSSDRGRALQKVNDNIHDIYSIVSVLRSELYRNVHLLLVVLLNILLDYFAHRVVYVVFANIISPPPRGGCM